MFARVVWNAFAGDLGEWLAETPRNNIDCPAKVWHLNISAPKKPQLVNRASTFLQFYCNKDLSGEFRFFYQITGSVDIQRECIGNRGINTVPGLQSGQLYNISIKACVAANPEVCSEYSPVLETATIPERKFTLLLNLTKLTLHYINLLLPGRHTKTCNRLSLF